MSLINDDDVSCRHAVAVILKQIITRADDQQYKNIIRSAKSWTTDERPSLQIAAARSLGLIFEVRPGLTDEVKFFSKHLRDIVANQAQILTISKQQDFDPDDLSASVLYHNLQTFLKVLDNDPQRFIVSAEAVLWHNIQTIILHKDARVSLSAASLVAALFTNRRATTRSVYLTGKDLELNTIDLVRICRHCIAQLRSPHLTEELALQLTKNIVFLLRTFEEMQLILPPKEELSGAEDAEDNKTNNPTCVFWLLKRITGMLQSDRDIKSETLFLSRRSLAQIIAAAITTPSIRVVDDDPELILRPLYKYAESSSITDDQSTLKELVLEAVELIKSRLGAVVFATAYNNVRQARLQVAEERRQNKIIENVRNPELGAAKRLKASERRSGDELKSQLNLSERDSTEFRSYYSSILAYKLAASPAEHFFYKVTYSTYFKYSHERMLRDIILQAAQTRHCQIILATFFDLHSSVL
ncbi:hypothetical protein MRB53_042145 [Persea americana]|nr:hypothetical protein MRB53_042145 [Persea americana]